MLSTYPLDDQFICLETTSDRLRIANHVGVAMLEYHESGCDSGQVAKRIAEDYAIPMDRAVSDTETFFEILQSGHEFNYKPKEDYLPLTGFRPERMLQPVAQRRLFLPQFAFTIRSESKILLELLGDFFKLPATLAPVTQEYSIDIYRNGDQWPIVHQGITLDTGLNEVDAAIKAAREINGIGTHATPWITILHAAAVAKGNRAVLIPAAGGSGKTTLAAYLMAMGYKLLNDDTVPLLETSNRLMPVPVALSVKRGSWNLLSQELPQLISLPEYGDHQPQIKYLAPNATQVATEPVECAAILLPSCSVEHVEPCIESMPRTEVVKDIIEGGCIMDRPLDPSKVASFVNWLDQTPCYRLRYYALDAAYSVIDQLLD